MILWPGSTGQTIFVICKIWLLVLPLVWLFAVDRGRPQWPRWRGQGAGAGLSSGIVVAGIIFAAYHFIGRRWIDVDAFRATAERSGLANPAIYIPTAIYWCLINSLLEEYVWRWFVYRQSEALLRGRSPAWAVILSALLFTVHHVVALAAQFDWRVTLLGSLGVFTGGAIWSALYLRYRSIWPGYIGHALADVPIFVIGYRMLFP